MSGKGSGRRPLKVDADVFAANWERVFGKGSRPTVPANLPNDSWGVAERSIAASSNLVTGTASYKASHPVGSNPTAPAIYIDNATGAEVS